MSAGTEQWQAGLLAKVVLIAVLNTELKACQCIVRVCSKHGQHGQLTKAKQCI